MNTATYVGPVPQLRAAALYKLNVEVEYQHWETPMEEEETRKTDHVIVSSIPGEVYAFPASKDGVILSWAELPGSLYKDGTAAEVLLNMGAILQ